MLNLVIHKLTTGPQTVNNHITANMADLQSQEREDYLVVILVRAVSGLLVQKK